MRIASLVLFLASLLFAVDLSHTNNLWKVQRLDTIWFYSTYTNKDSCVWSHDSDLYISLPYDKSKCAIDRIWSPYFQSDTLYVFGYGNSLPVPGDYLFITDSSITDTLTKHKCPKSYYAIIPNQSDGLDTIYYPKATFEWSLIPPDSIIYAKLASLYKSVPFPQYITQAKKPISATIQRRPEKHQLYSLSGRSLKQGGIRAYSKVRSKGGQEGLEVFP